ncbi:MAG: hypothetical protein AB1742_01890 [bacterium]
MAKKPGIVFKMLGELSGAEKKREGMIAASERYGLKEIRHINARLIAYPAFIAVVIVFTREVFYITLVQALLGTMSCYFIFVFARRNFGKPTAYTALVAAALYPPLVISAQSVMTETLTAFLLTLLLALSGGVLGPGRKFQGILSGIVLFLLMTCRLVFTLLPVVVFAAYILVHLCRKAGGMKSGTALRATFAAWLVPAIPWFLLMKLVFGGFMPPGAGGLSFNIGQNQEYRGYHHDLRVPEITPGLAFIMKRNGHETPTESDYREEALETIKSRPAGFIFLFFEKVERLWSNPHNEFKVNYILSYKWQRLMHRAIIISGLAGMLAASVMHTGSFLPISLILYATVAHGMTLSLARYNVPLMPVWVIFASFALANLGYLVKNVLPFFADRALFLCSSVLFAIYALKFNFLPLEAPSTMFKLFYFAGAAGVFSLFLKFHFRRMKRESNTTWKVCSGLFMVMVFACLIMIAAGNRYNLSWSCTISDGTKEIEQVITVRNPDALAVKNAYIYLDIQGEPYDMKPLRITLNSVPLKHAGQFFQVDTEKFQLLTGTYFYYMKMLNLHPNELRQWYVFPFDKGILRRVNTITLKWEDAGGGESRLRVYGDYNVDKSGKRVVIPYFCFSPLESCFLKFTDMMDYRIYHIRELDSERSRSRLIGSGAARGNDLCERAGYQLGQYRIRIVVETESGDRLVL